MHQLPDKISVPIKTKMAALIMITWFLFMVVFAIYSVVFFSHIASAWKPSKSLWSFLSDPVNAKKEMQLIALILLMVVYGLSGFLLLLRKRIAWYLSVVVVLLSLIFDFALWDLLVIALLLIDWKNYFAATERVKSKVMQV